MDNNRLNKYNNSKIYTIRCKDDDSLIYVGSSTQPLYKRWYDHKKNLNNEKYSNRLLYAKMKELGVDNFYIELYEECNLNNREQLLKKEGEVIREIGTLNKNIAGRTKQEHYNDNRDNMLKIYSQYHKVNNEIISIRHKDYYNLNKETIKVKHNEYIFNNKEKIKEYNKKYKEDNKEKIKEQKKAYNEINKDKIKEYYQKNKINILEKQKEKYLLKKAVEVPST